MTPAEKLAKTNGKPGKLPWGQRGKTRRKVLYNTKLREFREKIGLTQGQVMDATKVNNLYEIECGFEVHLGTALKLARFFGKSVEEIWEPVKS